MLCLDRPEDHDLLERTAELNVLREAVRRAAAGRGAAVVLDAPAGLGKTALLDRAAWFAEDAGALVRRAAPTAAERDFAYGVVRALLESPARALPARRLDTPAGRLLMGPALPRGCEPAIRDDFVRLCATMAAARPLALLVDDAQWADPESVAVLATLARAADDLPIVLVVAARREALDALAAHAVVLRPRPLTVLAAAEVIRRGAPDASLSVVRESHEAAGGSPWLLTELARRRPGHAGVRHRLAALSPRDRAVAAALAVLATGETHETAAALRTGQIDEGAVAGRAATADEVVANVAGVTAAELSDARDALGSAGLLADDRARLAHRLVAAAVVAGLPRAERERLHRRAGWALADDPREAAGHLLECEPQRDPDITAALLCAAEVAGGREAVVFLERALEERAYGDDRGLILARLAAAAHDAELPDARVRLREALAELGDRPLRVEVLTRLAALHALAGGEPPEELLAPVGDELAVAALDVVVAAPERAARLAALGESRDPAVLAHRAWAGAELATAGAEECAGLALEALADPGLVRRAAYHAAVRALIHTDRHAQAGDAIEALRAEAERRDSDHLRAAAAWHAGALALRTGALTRAEEQAREALAIAGDGVTAARIAAGDQALVGAGGRAGAGVRRASSRDALAVVAAGAREVLAGALIECGRFEDARELDAPGARGRLSLATGDYERALAESRDETVAALALAHLGRRSEAVGLADAAVVRAVGFGAPVPYLAALHARAVAEHDEDSRIALCRRALALAEGAAAALGTSPVAPREGASAALGTSPVAFPADTVAVLETTRLRLELGSALSRKGARLEAREALRPALAAAEAAGAAPLAERARRELTATGVRLRRAAAGSDGALTPRQRQICSLAASGKSNREIGHALFLSVKTVETHLAAAFRSLGVGSRAELAQALPTAG